MSETKINGTGIGVYISTNLTSPDYKLAVCLTTNGFDRKVNLIDTTSKCDAGTKNFEAGQLEWSMKGEGYAEKTPSSGHISYKEIDAILTAKAKVLVKVADDPTTPVNVGFSGTSFLTSLSETYADNEYVKFTFEFQGIGAYTQLLS